MALEPKLSYSNSRERHALDVFFLKTVLETLGFLLFPMLGKQQLAAKFAHGVSRIEAWKCQPETAI